MIQKFEEFVNEKNILSGGLEDMDQSDKEYIWTKKQREKWALELYDKPFSELNDKQKGIVKSKFSLSDFD